jgi:hypothetical protein
MSNHDVLHDAQAVQGRGIGVMFLAFFGSWWMAAIASRQTAHANSGSHGCKHRGPSHQGISQVNIAQWSACGVLVVILNILQRGEWIVPGIMFIVGLHFFPLAKLFRYEAHYLTGSALVALASSYPFIATDGPASAVGPIGAALILWISAAGMLIRAPR